MAIDSFNNHHKPQFNSDHYRQLRVRYDLRILLTYSIMDHINTMIGDSYCKALRRRSWNPPANPSTNDALLYKYQRINSALITVLDWGDKHNAFKYVS